MGGNLCTNHLYWQLHSYLIQLVAVLALARGSLRVDPTAEPDMVYYTSMRE